MNPNEPTSMEEEALVRKLKSWNPSAVPEDYKKSVLMAMQGVPDAGISSQRRMGALLFLIRSPLWIRVSAASAALWILGATLFSLLPNKLPGNDSPEMATPAHGHTLHSPDDAQPNVTPAALVNFDPILRHQRLRKVRDEGIVLSVGQVPLKRLHYEFVDTYEWQTADGHSTFQMELPREDFVLVPVSTY